MMQTTSICTASSRSSRPTPSPHALSGLCQERRAFIYITLFAFCLNILLCLPFHLSVIFTNSFLFHYHRFFNTIPIDYFFCQARISGFEVALIALENYIFRTIPDLDKERSACLESTHNRFRVKWHRVKNDLHVRFFSES